MKNVFAGPWEPGSAHLHCEMTNTQPLAAKLKSLYEVTFFEVGDKKELSFTLTENTGYWL